MTPTAALRAQPPAARPAGRAVPDSVSYRRSSWCAELWLAAIVCSVAVVADAVQSTSASSVASGGSPAAPTRTAPTGTSEDGAFTGDASIQNVSGATFTTRGYAQSALDAAAQR